MIDDAGLSVDHIVYDSFGNITDRDDPTYDLRFAYTGRELADEAGEGTYYYRRRFYDSINGRFLNQDPIGFAAGDTNLYRYVGNSPLNFTDPTGLGSVGNGSASTIKSPRSRNTGQDQRPLREGEYIVAFADPEARAAAQRGTPAYTSDPIDTTQRDALALVRAQVSSREAFESATFDAHQAQLTLARANTPSIHEAALAATFRISGSTAISTIPGVGEARTLKSFSRLVRTYSIAPSR